ncbi:MAG: T9SS type A sorting domain-containing protein [Bacteroidota bacterium]
MHRILRYFTVFLAAFSLHLALSGMPAYALPHNKPGHDSLFSDSSAVERNVYTLYPNPTASELRLIGLPPLVRVQVYNLLGQLIMNDVYQGDAFNMSHLHAGIYCVSVVGWGQAFFVKE